VHDPASISFHKPAMGWCNHTIIQFTDTSGFDLLIPYTRDVTCRTIPLSPMSSWPRCHSLSTLTKLTGDTPLFPGFVYRLLQYGFHCECDTPHTTIHPVSIVLIIIWSSWNMLVTSLKRWRGAEMRLKMISSENRDVVKNHSHVFLCLTPSYFTVSVDRLVNEHNMYASSVIFSHAIPLHKCFAATRYLQ
jgi:hypothetical protein